MSLISTNTSAPSWYIFDKIYPNRQTMDAGYSSDGVLLGRYVLVKYSEIALMQKEKDVIYKHLSTPIENMTNEEQNIYNNMNTSARDEYQYNLQMDDRYIKSYDRIFFRKGPNGYEEMDSLVIPEDLKQLGDIVAEAENNINIALQDIKQFKEDLIKDIKEEGGDIDIAAEVEEQVNTKLVAMVETF